MKHNLKLIISGGQTGADQGGLAAAKELEIPTGGYAPKGYRTEIGPTPELREYGLLEHSSPDYPPRTKLNVQNSEGTLIFGTCTSPGSRLTLKTCRAQSKPCYQMYWRSGYNLPRGRDFLEWLVTNKIQVLNVAGNRESSQPGIFLATKQFLINTLKIGAQHDHKRTGERCSSGGL